MHAIVVVLLMLNAPALEPADLDRDTLRTSNRARVVVLPIVFSSPDTRWAGGVLPQVIFHLPRTARPSTARLDAFYTQNGQFSIRLRPTIWFPGDEYNASLNAAWKNWPTTFYGVGSHAGDDYEESYSEHLVEARLQVMRRAATGFYAGLQYDLRHSSLTLLEQDGRLDSGTQPGSRGGLVSSVGVTALYDSRNHDFYPTAGGLYQVTVRTAGKLSGSDYSFSTAEADLRRYLAITRRQTVAVQVYARVTGGEPPFQMLPSVGSIFRGYETMRFIDAHLVAIQAEYRVMPIIWRVGAVGFAGVGRAAPRLGDLATAELKYVVGAGLRFQIRRQDLVNVRWDYGSGLDSAGDYLDLGEAY
jgi:outer membrane protein assembly factor BamA